MRDLWTKAWNELAASCSASQTLDGGVLPETWRGRPVTYRVQSTNSGGYLASVEVPLRTGQGTTMVGFGGAFTPEADVQRALRDARWRGLGSE